MKATHLVLCLALLSTVVLIGCTDSSDVKATKSSQLTPQDVGYLPVDAHQAGSKVSMAGEVHKRKDNGAMVLNSAKGKVALGNKSGTMTHASHGQMVVVTGVWGEDAFGRPVIEVDEWKIGG
jgi:hypothetical protein